MKVLMCETFLPSSTYTLELGEMLKNHVQLSVFCKKGISVPENGIHWLPFFYNGGKSKPVAMVEYLRGLMALKKELYSGEYDIVHVQSFKNERVEIPVYCRFVSKGTKLVHTVHNILPHEAGETYHKLYCKFYQKCDLLIVHNQYCRESLLKEFPLNEDKIKLIPHGTYALIDKIRSDPEGNRSLYPKINFLQFGNLREYKGIDLLLKAISLLGREERSHLNFLIAGMQFPKLDNTDYQEMIRELDISDCVTLRNSFIPQEQLNALFRDADICLFPYRAIYGSGALMMAYTYRKPVIVSDIPAFLEETEGGKTGAVFAAEDPRSLKDAILSATNWTAEQYRMRCDEIDKLVSEKYNWERSAKLLAEAYSQIWD